MSETGSEPPAVRAYELALHAAAERLAVDEAEEVVARAWITELDDMRRKGLRLAMAVRVAERMARESLREAQVAGRPRDLARAHTRFAEVEAESANGLAHADALVAAVDAELAAVCRAGLERARRGERELRRLRTAWTAAYDGAAEAADEPGDEIGG
jgi:hypothetical protein